MKPSVEQLENLLALRRDERPEEGYWKDFLCEFHHHQRERAVMPSGPQALFNKVSAWISEMGPSKWAYGAGLAYAAVAAMFLLNPRPAGVENGASTPVKYEVISRQAQEIQQLGQLDLSADTQGSTGEQFY